MTDCDLILSYLERFPGFQNSADMMRALKPGAVGWALRSRISNLKQRGFNIESRIGKNGMAEYKLCKNLTQPPVPFKYDERGQSFFA